MSPILLTLFGWVEAVCTFDAAQYGAALQTLQKEGIPCRTHTVNMSSASRRTGTAFAVGERTDRSIEYQIFVKRADLPKAQLALQGRLHNL